MGTDATTFRDDDDAVPDYSADQRLRGRAPGTRLRAEQVLRDLAKHAGCPAHEATPRQIRAFLDDAKSPGGAAFKLRTAKPFFKWCVKEGIRDDNPCDDLGVKAPDEPQTTATSAQIEQLLKNARAAGARDHALIALLVSTGARRSEVGLATFGDAREYLHQAKFRIVNSKSQPRVVPLDAQAERALRKYLRGHKDAADGENLWLVKLAPSLVSRVVWIHSNGELSPHAIRRWLVGDLIARGMSTASLGRLFGWSAQTTARMTVVYTKAIGQDLMFEEYHKVKR